MVTTRESHREAKIAILEQGDKGCGPWKEKDKKEMPEFTGRHYN